MEVQGTEGPAFRDQGTPGQEVLSVPITVTDLMVVQPGISRLYDDVKATLLGRNCTLNFELGAFPCERLAVQSSVRRLGGAGSHAIVRANSQSRSCRPSVLHFQYSIQSVTWDSQPFIIK